MTGTIQAENLVVAATFMAEPLHETLRFWVRELGLPLNICLAPYNQLFQQLLDPASLVRTNARGLNVLLVRWEDFAKASREFEFEIPGEACAQIEQNVQELLSGLKAAAQASSVPWFVCPCPASQAALANVPLAGLFSRLEQRLSDELPPGGNLHLVRSRELFDLYPVPDYDAPYSNQLGHMPYNALCYTALATLIARKAHALWQPPRKVVALDCDQTLWRGICGEDGPTGVELDAPRSMLQHFMRQQHDHGMLLCLCSKNNEVDVAEVFRTHPDMPLRSELFAAQRVNWRPKSENLCSLAEELNLGLDGFILVDDNPVECAEVEANCPGVLALPLPENPAEWEQFLRHIWAFDRVKLTAEDRRRTAFYQQERLRRQFQSEAGSLSDFLARLHLEICIEPARPEHLPRVAELIQRTNQFNCTAERRTEAEILKLHAEKQLNILVMTVSDRFGDYGLVGVAAYRVAGQALAVDTFLLSCRVLGKGVEHQLLAHLGRTARQVGASMVTVPFRPTGRNQPALDFLNSVGAEFRRDQAGSSTFCFPAAVAADIWFKPITALRERPPVKLAPAEAKTRSTVRHVWIARQAGSPEQIMKLVQGETSRPLSSRSLYVPPQTPVQRQLCELWQQLFRLDQVGIQHDFFELGGTSQLAVRLLAKWAKLTGQQLPLATLFKAPTIEKLALELAPGIPEELEASDAETSARTAPV